MEVKHSLYTYKKLLFIVTFFGTLSTVLSTCTQSVKDTYVPTYKDVLQCLTCQPKNMTTAYENKIKKTVESYVLARFKARIAQRKQEKKLQPYIASAIHKKVHLMALYQSPEENSFFKASPKTWGYCNPNSNRVYIQKRKTYKKYDAITLLFVIEHELTHFEHTLNKIAGAKNFLITPKQDSSKITLIDEEHEADTQGITNHPNPYLLFNALKWSFDHYSKQEIYNESYDEYLPLPLKYETAQKNYEEFYVQNPTLLTKHTQEAQEYMPPNILHKAWNNTKRLDFTQHITLFIACIILLALIINTCTQSYIFSLEPLALVLVATTLYTLGAKVIGTGGQRKDKIILCKKLHNKLLQRNEEK